MVCMVAAAKGGGGNGCLWSVCLGPSRLNLVGSLERLTVLTFKPHHTTHMAKTTTRACVQAKQFCIKTNLPVTTSMRAPGVVQAVMATEMVLAEVARCVARLLFLRGYLGGWAGLGGWWLVGGWMWSSWRSSTD
jgi:hypothetical protein